MIVPEHCDEMGAGNAGFYRSKKSLNGLHRLLQTVDGEMRTLSGHANFNQARVEELSMNSVSVVLGMGFVVFYIMTAVALNYANYVDGFKDNCGELWIVVLVATICRIPVASVFGYFSEYYEARSCICTEAFWDMTLRAMGAAPFLVLCCYEGISIHRALEDPVCKALMQDSGFRTPFLAEIGIAWMMVDCVIALVFVVPYLKAFHAWACFCGRGSCTCCGAYCNM